MKNFEPQIEKHYAYKKNMYINIFLQVTTNLFYFSDHNPYMMDINVYERLWSVIIQTSVADWSLMT